MSKTNNEEEFDMEALVNDALSIDDESYDEKPKTKKSAVVEEESGGSFARDPLETDDPNWKGFRYWTLHSGYRLLNIRFSKFFGKESEDYEDFITSCVQKKVYSKMMDLFCNTANVILNKNKAVTESFMYKYYCIKRNIDNEAYDSNGYQQFANAVVNMFDKGIVNEIRKYINENYHECGNDSEELNNKNYLPAITFLDRHIKVLFVVSRMIHLTVPLCLEYLRTHKDLEAKTFLADIFQNLFPIAQAIDPELIPLSKVNVESDVYQKLYSFVEDKVCSTLNSDKAMWERQAFLAVNFKTTIQIIVNKLIVDILPEYSFCGNVMHMNVAVVRKSIQDFTFRKEDPYNINCLVDADSNTSDDDNAVVTEAEQFDSYNAKHDELSIVIRHTFAEDTVNKIIQRKGVILNPSDIEFYMKNVRFHEFQTFAIFASTVRYFGGTENIYSLNMELYVKLMLTIAQMMDNSGLSGLSKYVLGTKNRHYISRKESRLSRNIILSDPLYNNILENKYKSVKNIIMKKNNFIESRISFLMNNEFTYNTPDPSLNGRIIARDEDAIRRDVLQFFNGFVY